MKIVNHQLKGRKISIQSSPNFGGTLNADSVIIHYTAGPSAQSAVNTFIDPDKKVSAHIVIDLNGAVTQLVPFDKIAWHAGKSRHKDRVGLNKYSIGIEIVNAGRLSKSGSQYLSWFGKTYKVEDVVKARHRNESVSTYWHRYQQEQIEVILELCDLLIKTYNIQYILGHEEIAPGRKIDPGPAFPLDKIRNRLLNSQSRSESDDLNNDEKSVFGLVTASKLNIRSVPAISGIKIANPLPNGKKVKILDKKEGWYKISTDIEGWVSSKYIDEV